jgi:hypothetical protein
MHTMSNLLKGIIVAAERRGEDGRGRDGWVGYLRWLAVKDPVQFAALIGHMLPLALKVPMKEPEVEYTTIDEIRDALRKGGMPDDCAAYEAEQLWSSPPTIICRDAPPEKTEEDRETARNLLEAIVLAAEQVGEDGCGRNGVVGFFYRLSIKHPRAFARLLCRAAPLEMAGSTDPAEKPKYRTLEEIREELRKCRLPDSTSYNLKYHDQEQVENLLRQKPEPPRR